MRATGVRDLIYRRLAQLLVQSRGAYGVEFARKRAVASRLMGDDAEFRHWARVWHDAELLVEHVELDPPYNLGESGHVAGPHTGELTLLVVPIQR